MLDWKLGKHKKHCNADHVNEHLHQPWCAYLDRDPEIDSTCLVEIGNIKEHPNELITTGMNTCIFVVVKTASKLVGWHASIDRDMSRARAMLLSIPDKDVLSAFVVPGEDRIPGTLDLKPTCRTIQMLPWTDPTRSRKVIFGILEEAEWFHRLEVLDPVSSYKDFVVFDMVHKRPYSFSNPRRFDEGCVFDANVD